MVRFISWVMSHLQRQVASCALAKPAMAVAQFSYSFLLIQVIHICIKCTVKKVSGFSRPQPGFYLPNSPWLRKIKLFPARVSDIPAGDGKIANLLLTVTVHCTVLLSCSFCPFQPPVVVHKCCPRLHGSVDLLNLFDVYNIFLH
jgi:hypothetical protein